MADSTNERVASAKAIAEALIGLPIVVSQQIVQRIGDIGVGRDATLAQRLSQLRTLGEMTVRLGTREVGKRFGSRSE
ncbi:MAG: hypothetical protein EBU98_07530 [Actinobacteria bacterium]|jgi:hypothetical protein|nr:hypothetical protein [Actinomycetota bacterium]NDG76649.1 hypothetical protein [Acidimicrobiia bacterium]NBO80611.1 hypothetical protein [Actinomycetota bacterium]NBP18480.1 hypothetical protein [Actinomycetota bacterium]NBY58172.1 hypothetical protein [Actinomycetota bacterium]